MCYGVYFGGAIGRIGFGKAIVVPRLFGKASFPTLAEVLR